jgi:hypothetical protein
VSSVLTGTGHEERLAIVTTLLRNGGLFHALVVAARAHFDWY